MRHKYHTQAVVLSRIPIKESAVLLTLLTEEFGLIRARAEGLRKEGAKLAHALQTLDRCEVTLVRGKDGWRLSGALLEQHVAATLTPAARERAGRLAHLMFRLVPDDSGDTALFPLYARLLDVLPSLSESQQDTAECYTALTLLRMLGLDTGEAPKEGEYPELTEEARRTLVLRINHGITASGL